MKKGIFALGALLVFGFAVPVLAAEVRTGDQVSVAQNEVVSENAYMAGAQVTLSGTMNADVIAGGGRVVIAGPVGDDVMVSGGTIDIFENVGGDVRAAGGQVTIAESVAGDVVVLGGSVSVLPGATIGGDLLVVGGAVFMDGTINGDARMVAGELYLNGVVAGNVSGRIGERVVLGEDARIGGDFTYHSTRGAEIPESAAIGGEVVFTQTEVSPEKVGALFAGIGIGIEILSLVVTIVGMLVILFMFPRMTRTITEHAASKPWQSVGVGLATLILTPIVGILLFVTLVGALLGGLVFAGFAVLMILTKALLGIVVGAYLARWTKKESCVSWKWAVLGALVVTIVGFIPVIGWVAVAIFFLMTFGALAQWTYGHIRAEQG